MGIAVTHVPGRLREVSLEDRWREGADSALMTGVQAIVRSLFDQLRADRAAGRRTGGFVSGYQGSPLGGLDKEIARRRGELEELAIAFQPGVNEELAATSVWGSQLAYLTPEATVDGVLGMWYGKNPGLDRAADAIRHANISGVGPLGGAVAVVGDDPACKSSTLPSAAERTLSGLMVPVLAPSSVRETLEYGRHAFALSRAAGLWAALKVVADVADASATVPLDVTLPEVERLVDFVPTARLLGAPSLEPERHLLDVRLPGALEYARRAGLNRVEGARGAARYGVVASGPAYADLRRALHELELDDDAALERLGLRILKVGMPWPLDGDAVRAFADGLETVLVLEDKLPFVETEVAAALLRTGRPPLVIGKRDVDDRRLLPAHGGLGADDVSRALATLLAAERDVVPAIEARLARVERATSGLAQPPIARAPYFCSGCPHNSSTQAEPDQLVGAGIGCHVMLVQQHDDRAGHILGLTQMGGEGAQWIGMAPFTERRHLTQNIGDGTFHHSGSLALRAAVAARVNVTYKLLYNDAVAMTGGQHVEGVMPVPELTRLLEAEGVVRTVVTTDDVKRYRGVRLAKNARVRRREQLDAVARELAALDGVTVILHDQQCAAEKRRLRKRGKLATPKQRVWINERVCEGCGDCGDASGCLSVVPTATDFGRKTQIHQASCNLDFSCLKGDCPSFLTVAPRAVERAVPEPPAVPDPQRLAAGDATIRMVGIGGTGVLTVAQVLAMAAHLEGRSASGLDQTGLSQKAGPVVSDLRITSAPEDGSARAAAAEVDVLLAFDVLATTQPGVLRSVDRERTVAVVSDSVTPTGPMVTDPALAFPDPAGLVSTIADRSARVAATIDAQALSERVFGDAMPANMVLIGAAWQCGLLPLGWDGLARAVELNGAAVETNLAALAWGRAAVAAPEEVERLLWPAKPAPAAPPAWVAERVAAMELPSAAARELALQRASDLVGWGGRRPAARFLDELERVAEAECQRVPGRGEVTEAFARGFHKLLAYKDEYEVARLHLLPEERARREAELGAGAPAWVHLHPPVLRALGMQRKLRLRRSATPLFRTLRALRGLRGTPLDAFGYAQVRRVERTLPDEYLTAVTSALARLGADTYDDLVALCASPDMVRGYEEIKLRNVERWRARVAELSAARAAAR
jgi:indolepyruvate ferredoxin oxidoreductase